METRELTLDERNQILNKRIGTNHSRENCFTNEEFELEVLQDCQAFNIPTTTTQLTEEEYKTLNV